MAGLMAWGAPSGGLQMQKQPLQQPQLNTQVQTAAPMNLQVGDQNMAPDPSMRTSAPGYLPGANAPHPLVNVQQAFAHRAYGNMTNSGGRIPIPNSNLQNAIQNPKFGPLVNNPNLQNQLLHPAPVPQESNLNVIKNAAGQVGQGIALGGVRTGIGLAQAGSGLVDLAGQKLNNGQGTSRTSKYLDNLAKQSDQQAQANNVDMTYKLSQVPLNVATFLGPSAATKAISTIPRVAKALDVASNIARPIKQFAAPATEAASKIAAKALPQTDAIGRLAGATVKGVASPSNVLNAASMTAVQAGTDTSKGGNVTAGDAAKTFAQNLAFGGALHVGGQVVKEIPGAANAVGTLGKDAAKFMSDRSAAHGEGGYVKVPGGAKDPAPTDPLQSLKQEALKHSSADEFVNKHWNSGQPTDQATQFLNNTEPTKVWAKLLDDKKNSEATAKVSANEMSAMRDRYLGKKNANLTDAQNKTIDTTYQQHATTLQNHLDNYGGFSTKGGYIDGKGKLLNSSSFNALDNAHKQLTDIYNQAHAEAKPAAPTTIASSTPKPPVTKAPLSIPKVTQPKAIAAPLVPKERGFTTSVKKSDVFSPELQQAVDKTSKIDNTVTDRQALSNAYTTADKTGIDVMHQQALKDAASNRVLTKQETVNAGVVLSHLSNQGRLDEALALHKLLAEKGTQGGQQSQAFAAILKHDPNMKFYEGIGKLTDNGVTVTDAMKGNLGKLRDNITATKPDTTERIRAEGHLEKYVAERLPTGGGEKLYALWRAGLLTGARTLGKIGTSHAVHSGAEALTNVIAAPIDRAVSLVSGKRSGSLTTAGAGKGFKQGVNNAAYSVKTGIETDLHNNTAEFRQGANFGVAKDGGRTVLDKATNGISSKLLNGYTNVGRLHGALYQPFNESFRQNEVQSLARAYAANNGLKGDAASAYVKDFVAHPESQAAGYAKLRADTATFQQDTALGKVASYIQQHSGPVGKIIVPFSKIPSAVATDVFNYSPAGAAKTILDGIKLAKSDTGWTVEGQRAFTQGLGRSIIGTAAIAPGMYLYDRNMMTGSYPTDPKEQKLWQQEGKTPNSVLVGGKWRSLGSLGPVGAALGIGAAVAYATQKGDNGMTALYKGLLHGAQAISEQSYLAGTNSAVNAIKDPGKYGGKLLNQFASSTVPTLVNNIAQATDKFTRRVDNPGQAIQNALPGAREKLPVKVDAFGKPLPTPQGGNPLAAIDPFYSYNVRNANDPQTIELRRLQDTGQGAMPASIKKVENLGNAGIKLNPGQVSDLQTLYGNKVQSAWNDAMKTPAYTSGNDIQKQKILEDIAKNAEQQAKSEYATANLSTLNSQVAKPGTKIDTSKLTDKPYSPPVPKDPSLATGMPKIPSSVHRTYDPSTNTFTEKNVNTGKTTSIAADGTRTITDPGSAKTSTSGKVSTTYNAQTKTFTQTNSKTGRTTTIASDGTRTVTNKGSGRSRGSRSGGIARSSRGRSFKQPRLASMRAPKMGRAPRVAVPKFRQPKVAMKAPKLTRKAIA